MKEGRENESHHDITNPFFAELVRGIEQVIQNEKYNMVLCNTSHRFQKEMEYMEMLRDKYVDGIIFMTSKVTADHRDFFSEEPASGDIY